MMLNEPEEQGSAVAPQGRTTLDLPLLTRDDDTWEQFQGANIVGDTALRGTKEQTARSVSVCVQQYPDRTASSRSSLQSESTYIRRRVPLRVN